MERYTQINPICKQTPYRRQDTRNTNIFLGLNYQMSMLVPPQFDQYGTTYWIPSQVEPSVALIGTALPALRPMVQGAAQRMTTAFSGVTNNSGKSTGHSGVSHNFAPERSLLSADENPGAYMELSEREQKGGKVNK